MNKEIIEKLMDKYAKGTLTSAEQKQLDTLVKGSPELKKELVIRKDIVSSIEYLDRKNLIEMIDQIHEEEINTPRKKMGWTKIASIIALILAGAFFLFKSIAKEEVEPTRIYASYYEAYAPVGAARSNNKSDLTGTFTSEYISGDYSSALKTILPTIENQENEIKLMAAIAAIETNDLAKANSLLDKIIEEKDYYYTDHARWYRALILIKESKLVKAKEELRILADDKSADHHQEASDLLSKI